MSLISFLMSLGSIPHVDFYARVALSNLGVKGHYASLRLSGSTHHQRRLVCPLSCLNQTGGPRPGSPHCLLTAARPPTGLGIGLVPRRDPSNVDLKGECLWKALILYKRKSHCLIDRKRFLYNSYYLFLFFLFWGGGVRFLYLQMS